jgi:hypothetical protein
MLRRAAAAPAALLRALLLSPFRRHLAGARARSPSPSAAARAALGAPLPPPETVAGFSDLKRLLRRVVLRVHPDVVGGAGLSAERARTNEASLQALFRLFDGLRARLGEGEPREAGAPAPAQPSPVAGTHAFSFWHAPLGGGGGEEEDVEGAAAAAPPPLLTLLRREFEVPAAVEARAAECARGGRGAAAAALWLALGADVVKLLGEGLGLFPRGAVQLAPAVRAALRAGAAAPPPAPAPAPAAAARGARASPRARAAEAPFSFATAEAAVRRNLLSLSPIQQGKGARPGPATLAEARALVAAPRRSLFSSAAAARAVDGVLGGRGFRVAAGAGGGGAPVSPAHARARDAAAVARLRAAMLKHHDALHLYHEAWPSVALTLGRAGGGWSADARARALTVPGDFTEEALVHFVRAQWPALQAAAVGDAVRAVAAGARAARKRRAVEEEVSEAAAYYR